jgi:DNA-binding winged helix-turn-helix (wHTH) protein
VDPGRVVVPTAIEIAGEFELDVLSRKLRRGGRRVRIERIPLEILIFLIEKKDELVTRDQIVDRIWGRNVFLDTDNSINGAIRKIRQVLRDDSEDPRFIQTVIGRGYRFIASVTIQSAFAPPPQPPTEQVQARATSDAALSQSLMSVRQRGRLLFGAAALVVVGLLAYLELRVPSTLDRSRNE